jgi:hypothetical protein
VSPDVCGLVALTEFVDPTITVRENGLAEEPELNASCSPVGLEVKLSTTVCGSSLTLVVEAAPLLSVAVSCSSRWDGYSWSGAWNDPPATPSQLWMTWVWHVEGQCCMSSVHERADAVRVLPSGSVAWPLKEIGSPTFQVTV